MSDLDAMHYDKTGKNHNGEVDTNEDNTTEIGVGDEELWKELS